MGQRLGHAGDVLGRRNRQHPFPRGQYRVAVEVGDDEAPVTAQHLTDVQVAVCLDDAGARERAEPAQDGLDLGAACSRSRDACGNG